jgi:hypothetical protein
LWWTKWRWGWFSPSTFDVFSIEISLFCLQVHACWRGLAVQNNMIIEVLDILSLIGTTKICKPN